MALVQRLDRGSDRLVPLGMGSTRLAYPAPRTQLQRPSPRSESLLPGVRAACRSRSGLSDTCPQIGAKRSVALRGQVSGVEIGSQREVAANMTRADGETAPKLAPFRLEESKPMEESPRHPQLITLIAIHQHPLPRH